MRNKTQMRFTSAMLNMLQSWNYIYFNSSISTLSQVYGILKRKKIQLYYTYQQHLG